MRKLVLIDSNALVHRAFHALPPLNNATGAPTNAVYGFTSVLLKMLKDIRPECVIAAFDLAGPTFRHEEFEDYKAHRVKAPDELYAQIPMVKEILTALGIPVFEKTGFEADDLIGSLAEHTKKESDLQTIIVTGDLDTLQLVEDDHVVVCTLRKGITDTIIYDEKAVYERFHLTPEQVTDFKGLKGDPSDNIPGVPGVGDKTASLLIDTYGSLEKLYTALENPAPAKKTKTKPVVSEKLAAKLLEHKEMAFFSKKLATIVRDVPLDFDLEKSRWHEHVDRVKLAQLLRELNFTSLLRRVDEVLDSATHGTQSTLIPPSASTTTAELSSVTADTYAKTPEIAVQLLADGRLTVATDSTTVAAIPAEQIGELLGQPREYIIGHDLKPLLRLAWRNHWPVNAKLFDTRIADYLIRPDAKQYDLPATARFILNTDIADAIEHYPRHLWNIREQLLKRLTHDNLKPLFEDIEMPLIPVLAAMEERGIAVDTKSLAALEKKVIRELQTLETTIHTLAGEPFNINSPAQLSRILFEKLDLKGKVKKTGKGALSTAAGQLEKLREEHPIIDAVLDYRELQKLKTTYLEPFPADVAADGRIHTTYNQAGAGTGRLSSQDPNLQNIPNKTDLGNEFRRIFIAPQGTHLVSYDYSQLELRLVAHIAKDEKMTEAFRRGEDIHTRTAVEVFQIKPEDVTRDMRRQAKVLNFGIIYGMGSLAFAQTARVTRTQAKEFMDRYFAEFSGVAAYMERVKEQARTHGFVETIFGRRRPLPDIDSMMPQLKAQAERMAINHPVQGTEADIVKLAMIKVDAYLTQERQQDQCRMLLQVHDELVCEVSDTVSEDFVRTLGHIMESVVTLDVPLIVDIKQGSNWSDMQKLV